MDSFVPFAGVLAASTADLSQPNLPPLLQIAELGSTKGLNLKLEDDGVVLNSSESATHKKLDNICQCLHKIFPDASNCPTVMGFQCSDNKRKDANNINSKVLVGKQMISTSQSSSPFPVDFNAKQEKHTSKLSEKFQRVEGLELGDLGSCNMSTSTVCDGSQMSPTSVISVTTDLGLGMCSSPTSNESKKPSTQYTDRNISSFSSTFSVAGGNILKHPSQPSTLNFDFCGQVDARNPKILFDVLAKEVSWQDEALSVISRTITGSHIKRVGANQRGDIWMNFVGPDRNGKRKIAVSLAKFLCGNRDSFIFVDLSSEEIKGCDVKFRGKTTLDFIVGEYCKKPFSVVFLENADKADVLVQNSLSQAIKTGKLNDSHGREVSVNNAIFVTSFSGHQAREPSNYSEERIVKVKGRPIKITVEHVIGDIRSQSVSVANGSIESISNPVLVNKRKFIGHNEFHDQQLISDTAKRAHTRSNWHLDLNLPAEENELQVQQMNDGNSEHASTENQNLWLQDLYDQVDETVVFRPFNFDALADRVLKVITSSFHKTIGSECALQIESEVMNQLLAAAYVSDGDKDVENWVEDVLSGGFTQVQKRYNLTACSIVKLVICSHHALSVYLPPSIKMD
ncbi:Protein SMAX1-LIKE 8, partial [Mucuna pruriens]